AEQFGKSKIIRELSQERHFPRLSTAPSNRVFLAENRSLNTQSRTVDPTARWTVHSSDRNVSELQTCRYFGSFSSEHPWLKALKAGLGSCHFKRGRRSEAPEEEWRDPEDARAASLIQGILPECHSLEPAQWRM